MLDALHDEFDLFGQRFVLLPIHQFLEGEVDHDDLSTPHGLPYFLLLLFLLLLAALDEVPELLLIHGGDDLVHLDLFGVASLDVAFFLELGVVHISFQLGYLLLVLLVARFVLLRVLPFVLDEFLDALLEDVQQGISLALN